MGPDNTCGYSDNWQPYIGDYDKYEFDIKLKDGTIVENCYPNAGKFNSISDEHNGKQFLEEEVVEIRFSQNPRYGLGNPHSSAIDICNGVSNDVILLGGEKDPDIVSKLISSAASMSMMYEGMDQNIFDGILPNTPKHIQRGKRLTAEDLANRPAKVGRNDPCPCQSGKKFKKCCLNKTTE